MKYPCGTEAMLGDVLLASHGPGNESPARIVAIGLDQVSECIDQGFYKWAKEDEIIDRDSVVIEWLEENPLENKSTEYAPVGNYMTLQSLCCETFVRRGTEE